MAIYLTNQASFDAEVRRQINESAAGFWTNADITAYVKEGAVAVSSLTGCFELIQGVTLVSGTDEYTTNLTDVVRVNAVQFITAGGVRTGLVKLHPRVAGKTAKAQAGADSLYHYYWFLRTLTVTPKPNATSAAGTLDVYCSKVTDDVTNIPDEFKPMVVMYAISRALIKDRRITESNNLLQQFISIATAYSQLFKDIETETAAQHSIQDE